MNRHWLEPGGFWVISLQWIEDADASKWPPLDTPHEAIGAQWPEFLAARPSVPGIGRRRLDW